MCAHRHHAGLLPRLSPGRAPRPTWLAACLVVDVVVGGCGSLFKKPEPPPFVAPAVQAAVTHYAGTALSGPTTRPVPVVPPDQALAVRVRFVALENVPTGGGQPLSAAARLVTADRLGTPMLASPQLARAARLVPLASAEQLQSAVVAPAGGRSADLFDGTGAVAPGVTAAFVLADPTPPDLRPVGGPTARRVELYVSRPAAGSAAAPASTAPASRPAGDPVQLALVVQAVAPLPREDDRTADDPAAPGPGGPADPAAAKTAAPAPPAIVTALQREVALVDRAVDGRDVVCFVLPFRFEGDVARAGGGKPTAVADGRPSVDAKAIAVVVELARDPGSPAHLEAMSRAVEEGRRSAEAVARKPAEQAAATGRDAAALVAAVEGWSGPATGGDPRASLVYLAGQTKAHLCEDVALVADDATLAALVAQARAVLAPPAPATTAWTPGAVATSAQAMPTGPADLDAVGWTLDKATFVLLGQLVANNKLPTELAGVLSTHMGEAGRHPSSFEEVGRAAAGRADFDNRLVAENLIYLEDSSPSARVRAFDWLRGRGKAPAGYDPLGEPRDRRAALDRAANGPGN